MQRVLVTGAEGFIGKILSGVLSAAGYRVRSAVRAIPNIKEDGFEYYLCGEINDQTNWVAGLKEVDAIIHLADRMDSMDEVRTASDKPLSTSAATIQLARAADACLVKQFIYLSSIKVNGENSGLQPYSAESIPAPENDYARGKLQTEHNLLSLNIAMSVVVIRPPLVYGPGAGGNFALIKKFVAQGIPLPFSSVHNSRSMVSVFNLCDFIRVCLEHKDIDREVFLVSDGNDLSTPELIRLLSVVVNKKPRLFYSPQWVLELLAGLFRQKEILQKLCGNLQVDIDKNKRLLGWSPPFTVEESLRKNI